MLLVVHLSSTIFSYPRNGRKLCRTCHSHPTVKIVTLSSRGNGLQTTDEGELKKRLRQSLQTMFPVCGDLLLGETQIRRQLLSEVNVPTGAQVMISNNRHARTSSLIAEMRQRRDALLHKELNYNLFALNCEHFATFIRYGQAVCNQIPGRSKNTECESATKVFQDIVHEVWP
ncbi:uncharacterized protein [Paramormyrops kingsleyae]|uniref:uncharacterized protein isoform X2 n=1 Tax=Paramormyrops kingsleyae TaxID=1676925 RepID=UPI000CD604A3|nr:uncharacterized protein LOC111842270 isoform X2 [Paramormyrops kingsleyae]